MESISSYQKVMSDQILNTRPELLMVMLYDGMITRLVRAQELYQQGGQTIRFKEAVSRTIKIADALMENLNLEEGGEVAQNLERLYAYVISELSQGIFFEDPLPVIENILSILKTLQESWQKLASKG